MALILVLISFIPHILINLGSVLAGVGILVGAIAVGFMVVQLKQEEGERELLAGPLLSPQSVDSYLLRDQKGQENFLMRVGFKNYGESPAINIAFKHNIACSKEMANSYLDNFKKKNYDGYTFTEKIDELMPGQEKYLNHVVPRQVYENIIISKQDFILPNGQIFKSDDGWLYMAISVKYTHPKIKKIGTYSGIIRFGPIGNYDYVSSNTT
jgi:hypothetical protein